VLQDFWAFVQGEKNEGVSIDTLKVALLNCIGIKVADREVEVHSEEHKVEAEGDEAAEHPEVSVEQLGQFDDNLRFNLRKGSHQRVFTHFKNFYIHRVHHVGKIKKFSKDFVQLENRDSHKPLTSEKNNQLAENKRRKITGGREGVSHVEILLHPIEQRSAEWVENQRKAQENSIQGGCTFKPQTLDYQPMGGVKEPTHGDKCLDLYSRVKRSQYKEKQNKTKNDYEFGVQEQECTFAPKINEEGVV
jgi:hypothetical protein